MPVQQFITLIPGVKIYDLFETSVIILRAELERATEQGCPRCQSKQLRVKATVIRRLKHALWGGKPVHLHIRVPKFLCKLYHR